MTEMKFLLDDVFQLQKHYEQLPLTGGPSAGPEMVDMVMTEMAKFAENELSPLNEVADSEGCTYVNEYEVCPFLLCMKHVLECSFCH